MKIGVINRVFDKCCCLRIAASYSQHRTGGRTVCTVFADTQLISGKKKDEREMCSDSRGQKKKKICEVSGVKIQFKDKKCKSVSLAQLPHALTYRQDKVMRRLQIPGSWTEMLDLNL